MSSAIVIWWSW